MTKLPIIIITLVLTLFTAQVAFAAGFSLTYIGTLATNGAKYNHWWYTVANPTLKGTATASTAVTVTIDSVASSVTSDAAGVWTFVPTTLTNGDHQVSLSSGGETIAFTLTIGSTMPSQSSGSGTPTTASTLPVAVLVLVSVLSLGFGYRLLKSS